MNHEQTARAPEESDNRATRYALLFVLFFVSYAYFFQGGGWNQNIRICLTRALIHEPTFSGDSYREDAGEMAFVNSGDWAY